MEAMFQGIVEASKASWDHILLAKESHKGIPDLTSDLLDLLLLETLQNQNAKRYGYREAKYDIQFCKQSTINFIYYAKKLFLWNSSLLEMLCGSVQ